jgi:hypothetical protein
VSRVPHLSRRLGPDSMHSFLARLQSWIEAVSVTWWAACAGLFAVYWWIGAGLHWRPRGLIALFELLVLPAPFLMAVGFVMSLLWARGALVSGNPAFRRWLRILSWWLFFTGTSAADIWRRFDPDALTSKHPLPAPLISPMEWGASYLGVWPLPQPALGGG